LHCNQMKSYFFNRNALRSKIMCLQNGVLQFADPSEWSEEHVAQWLQWVSKQFSLPPLSPEDFPKTGQELCALSKSQLLALAGPRAGSVLAAHLANLKHSVTGRSPSPLGDIRLDIEHSEPPTGRTQFSFFAFKEGPLTKNSPINFAQSWAIHMKKSN
jgi:hypothetical protein